MDNLITKEMLSAFKSNIDERNVIMYLNHLHPWPVVVGDVCDNVVGLHRVVSKVQCVLL